MTASTVECWVNPSAVKPDERARWEPRFFWPRQGRAIHLSDLKDLSLSDLEDLRSDTWNECEELSGSIAANRAHLCGMPKEQQPMAVRQLNRNIKMMLVKRKAVKAIFFETDRLIKRANTEKNKPKASRRIITNQKEYDAHQKICKQMDKFKKCIFYELLKDQIGAEAIESLRVASVEPALQKLIAWGKENDAFPAELIEHEVESQRKELAARIKSFNTNTTKGA